MAKVIRKGFDKLASLWWTSPPPSSAMFIFAFHIWWNRIGSTPKF